MPLLPQNQQIGFNSAHCIIIISSAAAGGGQVDGVVDFDVSVASADTHAISLAVVAVAHRAQRFSAAVQLKCTSNRLLLRSREKGQLFYAPLYKQHFETNTECSSLLTKEKILYIF